MNSLGFAFDATEVETEIGALKNVVQEYYKQLFLGTADTDSTLSAFSSKMKAAGVDDVIAEMQRQYDEWRKNVGK
jgi:putative aldouronate transport system substrate-binding protein